VAIKPALAFDKTFRVKLYMQIHFKLFSLLTGCGPTTAAPGFN